jgi:hypothetical protein
MISRRETPSWSISKMRHASIGSKLSRLLFKENVFSCSSLIKYQLLLEVYKIEVHGDLSFLVQRYIPNLLA